jgi:hypothetical protein
VLAQIVREAARAVSKFCVRPAQNPPVRRDVVDGQTLGGSSAAAAPSGSCAKRTSGSIAAARGRKYVGESVWKLWWWLYSVNWYDRSATVGEPDDGRKWWRSLERRDCGEDMT